MHGKRDRVKEKISEIIEWIHRKSPCSGDRSINSIRLCFDANNVLKTMLNDLYKWAYTRLSPECVLLRILVHNLTYGCFGLGYSRLRFQKTKKKTKKTFKTHCMLPDSSQTQLVTSWWAECSIKWPNSDMSHRSWHSSEVGVSWLWFAL